ncbi:MAG: hypothetical protein Q8K99_04940 [Actinomycetota bacterium]|nr:hypothetical protein [Actinomycetota bacterium]
MPDQPRLLALFENAGLLDGQRLDERRILKLSAGQLDDIGAQAGLVTDANDYPAAAGSLTHSASLALGGGAQRCRSTECRIGRLDKLAQFAALYSDRVYMHNFIADHQRPAHHGELDSLEERRYWLLEDLQVLRRAVPLIEAGLIAPITAPEDVCNSCISVGAFGTGADERFERERSRLVGRFFNEVSVAVRYEDPQWVLDVAGPEDLLEHGGLIQVSDEPPKALTQTPRLLERARRGEWVTLSDTAKKKVGLHVYLADTVLGSVLFEMAAAQVLRTSYLNDADLHVSVLAAVSGDKELTKRNELVQEHLTSLVPFLADVPPDTVVKLREREGEAFVAYRQALNRAVDDVRSRKTDFTESDARSIYSDVIQPELVGIDRAIRNARRTLSRDLGRSIVGWSAAIGFGMYTGLLPAQLAVAAKALGLTKVLADGVTAAGGLISGEAAVRNEDMFFLWKVRQTAHRSN